ncbi:unnamed protein product [Vitrella brassicaformis CCMP3155]|uniref:Uncharacterized protein n=2 Tax=Vitrella brassicaformis TaxID=1169539 RepID=A0A0G4FQY9_VITBC|nr:unnamed protein product [Vitrella brassicaformis CCMP3155]|eukprot:CEM16874.1 unnamed protein product [Vitrella brassicaformis CCMP3155]
MGLQFYTVTVVVHRCSSDVTACFARNGVHCRDKSVQAPPFGDSEVAFEQCHMVLSEVSAFSSFCSSWSSYGRLRDKAAERDDHKMKAAWDKMKWAGILVYWASSAAFALAAAGLVCECRKPTNLATGTMISAAFVLVLLGGVLWRDWPGHDLCFGNGDMHGAECSLGFAATWFGRSFYLFSFGVFLYWGALAKDTLSKRRSSLPPPVPFPQPPAHPLPAVVGNVTKDSTGGDWEGDS